MFRNTIVTLMFTEDSHSEEYGGQRFQGAEDRRWSGADILDRQCRAKERDSGWEYG